LTSHISTCLAKHVLSHTTPRTLHCHTEYKSAGGQIYHAHSWYHGKPCFDYALVNWHGYDDLFPGCIHAFLNLCNVRNGSKIRLPYSGQEVSVPNPGFYAVIESYNEVLPNGDDSDDDGDDKDSGEIGDDEEEAHEEGDRSIFRKFQLDLIPNSLQPILYLIHVDSIKRPTVAVADTFNDCGHKDDGQSIPNAMYIFMMLPQTEWSKTWDLFIHRTYKEIVVTKKKAESDESGDDGFQRPDRIVPPSPASRRSRRTGSGSTRSVRKPTVGKRRKASTVVGGGESGSARYQSTDKRQRT
jgi:hypothetical protein